MPPDGPVAGSLGRAGTNARGRSRSNGRAAVDLGGADLSGAPVGSESREPLERPGEDRNRRETPKAGRSRASSRARRYSGPRRNDRRKGQQFRDGGPEVGHDMQVIVDVPAGWTLSAPACQEILDVITAVARRATWTDDKRVAG